MLLSDSEKAATLSNENGRAFALQYKVPAADRAQGVPGVGDTSAKPKSGNWCAEDAARPKHSTPLNPAAQKNEGLDALTTWCRCFAGTSLGPSCCANSKNPPTSPQVSNWPSLAIPRPGIMYSALSRTWLSTSMGWTQSAPVLALATAEIVRKLSSPQQDHNPKRFCPHIPSVVPVRETTPLGRSTGAGELCPVRRAASRPQHHTSPVPRVRPQKRAPPIPCISASGGTVCSAGPTVEVGGG